MSNVCELAQAEAVEAAVDRQAVRAARRLRPPRAAPAPCWLVGLARPPRAVAEVSDMSSRSAIDFILACIVSCKQGIRGIRYNMITALDLKLYFQINFYMFE